MNRNRHPKNSNRTNNNLSLALHKAETAMVTRDWATAIKAYRQVLRDDPKNADAWTNLGGAYIETGSIKKANEALSRAHRINPSSIPVLGNLANLKKQLGEVQEAEKLYKKILSKNPSLARAWQEMAHVKRFHAGDTDIEAMQHLYNAGRLDDEGQMHLAFALGKAHEDTGDYDTAFPYFVEGNQIKRRTLSLHIDSYQQAMEKLIEVFDGDFLARQGTLGCMDQRPIFILGMPRSGTTLVEQILASHKSVYGAGELENLSHIISKTISDFPVGTGVITTTGFSSIGQQYIRQLENLAGKAQHITDKMPRNFLFIGLIALILPNARIIHCQRSPLDTCVSCFTLHFPRGQEFSYDLEELGSYYQFYRRLMDHWHRVLPGFIFDIAYEDLVKNPENKTRELLDFCGLDWDKACLDFHKSKRQITTASAVQVREPPHTRSVGRWRRFKRHLAPLKEALGSYAKETLNT